MGGRDFFLSFLIHGGCDHLSVFAGEFGGSRIEELELELRVGSVIMAIRNVVAVVALVVVMLSVAEASHVNLGTRIIARMGKNVSVLWLLWGEF